MLLCSLYAGSTLRADRLCPMSLRASLQQNAELTKGYREAQAKERKLDEELNWILDSIAAKRPELLAPRGAAAPEARFHEGAQG